MRFPVLWIALFTCAAASALPRIDRVSPNVGFVWGSAHVAIDGADFAATASIDCTDACTTCPVTVLFDNHAATVLGVTPSRIVVASPPHARGTVDVTVRIPGRIDAVAQDAFTYQSVILTNDPADYVRYLIPIRAFDTPGAYGSSWRSELSVVNASDHEAVVHAPWCDPQSCPTYPARRTALEALPDPRRPSGDGAFVYVPRGVRAQLGFKLRVRDTSREVEGWGTEVPVVPEEQFARVQQLLDVPTDARYRATLRVYGDAGVAEVRVRAYAGAQLVDERLFGLMPASEPRIFVLEPAYAQLDPLTPAVRAAAGEVRLEVEAVSPGRIWAFASVTNNDTQQVTTVTP